MLQTPPGDYHVRMNATIFDRSKGRIGAIDGDPIGPFTQRTPTFPITQSKPFECTVPPFEPLRSVSDPTFTPLRIAIPRAGDVLYLTPTLSTIDVTFHQLDLNYDVRSLLPSSLVKF
jgi:hypothetical protein